MASEAFTTPNKYPTDAEAMKARNARAKELRSQGYTVVCKKWSFGGLGYGNSYTIDYHKTEARP